MSNREKAPSAFDDELDSILECLEDRPALVALAVEQDQRVRRVYLRRIRFFIYFQISEERGVVLALWHGHRDGHDY